MGKHSTFLNNGINNTIIDQITSAPPPPPPPSQPFLNANDGETLYKLNNSEAISKHEYFNVELYGVSSMNAPNQNTAALNNLILNVYQNYGGGLLWFEEFYEFDPLTITDVSNIVFLGASNNSTIQFPTLGDGFTFINCQNIYFNRLTIKKINIVTNFTGNNITFQDCFNCKIFNVSFRQGFNAITVNLSNQIKIKDCLFRNIRDANINIIGSTTNQIYIKGCQFDRDTLWNGQDITRKAIQIGGFLNAVYIDKCYISNCNFGVYFTQSFNFQQTCKHIYIRDSRLENMVQNAIRADNILDNVNITGCYFNNNGREGGFGSGNFNFHSCISSPHWVDVTIKDNEFYRNRSTCIRISGSVANTSISRNKFMGNGSTANAVIRAMQDNNNPINYMWLLRVDFNIFGDLVEHNGSNSNFTVLNSQGVTYQQSTSQNNKILIYEGNTQLYRDVGNGTNNQINLYNSSFPEGSIGISGGGSGMRWTGNMKFTTTI